MSKQNQPGLDERRLTGHLTPSAEWGPCIGFWATTYEFNAEYFEVDFLPTFLGLGAWDDRNWASRISIERALDAMDASTVLLDSEGYHGRPRSLRMEVLPGKGAKRNRLHAKVLIAVYEDAVRLLVGSANLTKPGYRENIEVVTELVATAKQPEAVGLIAQAIEGTTGVLAPWPSAGISNLNAKVSEIIGRFAKQPTGESEWFCWGGGLLPIWQQFLAQWPTGEPVKHLTIVSPFWSEAGPSCPLNRLLRALEDRDAVAPGMRVDFVTDAVPTDQTGFRPVLPLGYAGFTPAIPGVEVWAQAVDPHVLPEEVQTEKFTGTRHLHAKVVMMEGSETTLLFFGSANFTARGWGFDPVSPNIEAGILMRRTGRQREELRALVPKTAGEPVRLGTATPVALVSPPSTSVQSWPTFIRDIRLTPDAQDSRMLHLLVTADPSAIDGEWHIETLTAPAGGDLKLALSATEQSEAFTGILTRTLLDQLLTDQAVRIRWWACDKGVDFPLNVDAQARDLLPVSPEGGNPSEELLLSYYQGRIHFEDLFPPVDPEQTGVSERQATPAETSAVDTSGIQSYQIREFVESLDGIRDDLKEAQNRPRTMRQALLGPVSPVALVASIMERVEQKKRTPMAAAFQLVELQALIREPMEWPTFPTWAEHRTEAENKIAAALERIRQANSEATGSSMFKQYEKTILSQQASFGGQE